MIYPTVPPMVEYTLTPEAVTLLVSFLGVIEGHVLADDKLNGLNRRTSRLHHKESRNG